MSFNPWLEPRMPAPVVYQQPVPRPVQPRPKPVAPVAAAPVFKPVHVPPPGQLGIALADPPVEVPPPEKLGIRLD